MKISIITAARLLGLSAHLLRWRIVRQRVLKFATRTPRQTVLLADVLAYRDVCPAPLKKPGRPSASATLLSDLSRLSPSSDRNTPTTTWLRLVPAVPTSRCPRTTSGVWWGRDRGRRL
jgi:hypothetical protein